jgi:hypothetical protein
LRDGEIDRRAGTPVDLGELVVGAREADLESFDFAGLALVFGLADPGGQVVADLGDAGRWAGSGQGRAAEQACSWMPGGGAEVGPEDPAATGPAGPGSGGPGLRSSRHGTVPVVQCR